MKILVLLSGPIGVGKSSVAKELTNRYNFRRISTGSYLAEHAKKHGGIGDRAGLQEAGDALDVQTDFRWVVDNVAVVEITANPEIEYWLLDSVRKERQVQHFRVRYRSQILHIHLTASEALLQKRYSTRLIAGGEYSGNTPYHVAISHPNEQSSRDLINIADVVIDVAGLSAAEMAEQVYSKSIIF